MYLKQKMMNKKRGQQNLTTVIVIALILIIASGIGGYFLGINSMKEYQIAIDEFFPELPDEIFSVGGEIKEISDNFLILEIPSFERYLPGKEMKFISITANTNQDTQIYEYKLTPESEEKIISLPDLEIGDYVTIESNENIKNQKSMTATIITKFIEPEESFEEIPAEILQEI